MNPLLLYGVKVIGCSGVLFGYYWLFLRNKQFHHYNRFYLLATLVLSIVLPFFKIPVPHPNLPEPTIVYEAINIITIPDPPTVPTAVTNNLAATRLFTFGNIVYILFAVGILTGLAMLTRSLIYIYKLTKKYSSEKIDDLQLFNTREPGTPFSFLRILFWNEELSLHDKKGQQIFRHELFHIRQYHTLDILLAEFVIIIGWFNPFFYFIRKELKAIHEFLADQYAVSNSDRYAYAELLVEQAIIVKKQQLITPFLQNHLKRRLAMITRLHQIKHSWWSRMMILPVIILLFCAVTLKAQQFRPANQHTPENVPGKVPPAKETRRETVINNEQQLPTNNEQQLPPITVVARAPVASQKQETSRAGSGPATGLTPENARMLVLNSTTQKEVVQLFGEPSMSVQENASETWSYLQEKGLLTASFGKDDHILKYFRFYLAEEVERRPLNAEAANTIRHARTTAEEIKQLFGKPLQVFVEPYGETWVYFYGDIPQLTVHFAGQQGKNLIVTSHQFYKLYPKEVRKTVTVPLEDSLLTTAVLRHFNRSLRYPQSAIDNSVERSVYCSFIADGTNTLKDFQLHNKVPARKNIHEVIVVSYGKSPGQDATPAASTLPEEEGKQMMESEAARAAQIPFQSPPPAVTEPTRIYLKITWRLEARDAAAKPQEQRRPPSQVVERKKQ